MQDSLMADIMAANVHELAVVQRELICAHQAIFLHTAKGRWTLRNLRHRVGVLDARAEAAQWLISLLLFGQHDAANDASPFPPVAA